MQLCNWSVYPISRQCQSSAAGPLLLHSGLSRQKHNDHILGDFARGISSWYLGGQDWHEEVPHDDWNERVSDCPHHHLRVPTMRRGSSVIMVGCLMGPHFIGIRLLFLRQLHYPINSHRCAQKDNWLSFWHHACGVKLRHGYFPHYFWPNY